MSVFPNLSGGAPIKYPMTRGTKFRTNVATFTDLSEQRWSRGNGALAAFSLIWNNLSTVDKETLRGFFDSTYGSYDATWQLTIQDGPDPDVATTYYNLQFVPGSAFVAQLTSYGRWRVTLQVRQTNATNPPNYQEGAGGAGDNDVPGDVVY